MFYADRTPSGIFDCRSLLKKERSCLACLLVLAFISLLCEIAEAGDPLRYRAGLRLSAANNRLNEKEQKAILESLREKSGLREMGFDEDGFLSLGDTSNASGGSQTARDLLLAALNLSYAIDIESHNNSKEIAFGRLDKPVHFTNFSSGDEIDVYPIQIDFTDFKRLRGDREVIESFDVGFVILHELGHAVLGLHDMAESGDGPGECETYINRIRHDLGYPIRENYIATTYRRAVFAFSQTVSIAELRFIKPADEGSGKSQHYILNWQAHEVGPIVSIDSRAHPSAASGGLLVSN